MQYRFNDLYKAPQLPGFYAWFAAPTRRTALPDYRRLFRAKTYLARLYGNMSERYTGRLKPDELETQASLDNDGLTRAAAAFSPPLYIGVSNNLQRRLRTHAEQITLMLNQPERAREAAKIEDYQWDTDDESASFAARVSLFMHKKEIEETAFFVRVVHMPDDYPRRHLLDVEAFLNRTYFPVFGRR